MATFYIDTDNFSTATAVWEDPNLTIKAPDGFYSLNGIYRQQSNGILLIAFPCETSCKLFIGIIVKGPGGGPFEVGYIDCNGNPNTFTFDSPVNPEYPDGEFGVYINQEINPAPCVRQGSLYKISGPGQIFEFLYDECPSPIVECDELQATAFESGVTLGFLDCTGEFISVPLTINEPFNFCAKRGTATATGASISTLGPCPSYPNIHLSLSTSVNDCLSPSVPTTFPYSLYVYSLPINVGDIIYNTIPPSSLGFEGNSTGYYWAGPGYAYRINNSGEVLEVIDCT